VASLDFFAGPVDARAILAYAMEDLGCLVYEAFSPYDSAARQLTDLAAVEGASPRGLVADALETAVMLSLWAPSTGGGPVIQRIALKLKGLSFRETVVGWGVMRLNFGVVDRQARTLSSSGFGHNSVKRALKWEDASGERLGPVSAWDWDELERISRKLRYHIRQRLGVTKLGSAPVLGEAQRLQQQGYDLRQL